jgi:hypothetical protein
MATSNLDYNRLNYLKNKIKAKTASKSERDEYMLSLYRNGNITKKQYDDYLENPNSASNDVVEAALTIGGVVLLAYLLSQLFGGKNSK